jgi:uncharacterized protein (DUF1499 family)
MPTDRARDVALIEASFRIANERMARWEERHAGGTDEIYLCECASQPCRLRVRMSRDEYEAVRADPQHFLVVPGHVLPDLETVVRSNPTYEVIEKPAALLGILTETDPRQQRTGESTAAAEALADEIDPERT